MKEKNKPAEETIIIADECGDSIWDTVLALEVNDSQIIDLGKNAEA